MIEVPLYPLMGHSRVPLSSEYCTHNAVKARFWPWLSGRSLSVDASSLGSGWQTGAPADTLAGSSTSLTPRFISLPPSEEGTTQNF